MLKCWSSKGVQVCEASDGLEALKLLQSMLPFRCLLSDIMMPNMNGYELVEASLKMRRAESPDDDGLSHRPATADRAEGARDRTLIKPFDPDRMCDL